MSAVIVGIWLGISLLGVIFALFQAGLCLGDTIDGRGAERRLSARLTLWCLGASLFAWLWPVVLPVGLVWLARTAYPAKAGDGHGGAIAGRD